MATASVAVEFGEAFKAADNSFKKTITMDEEFVTKSKKASTGRFLERWLDSEMRKAVRV